MQRGCLARVAALAVLGLCAAPRAAGAQQQGFRLDRYEPTTAGSWHFLVDRPWYASTRWAAVGLTLAYAHDELRLGDSASGPVIEHSLGGSLDVAGSPVSWLLLRGNLPVSLLEQGTPDASSGLAASSGVVVGDPRLGVMFRLWGQPERDRISVHLGIDGWLPTGGAALHQGDAEGRAMLPRLVLAGTVRTRWRWTVDSGFLYRRDAILGQPGRALIGGSELQLGLAVALATLAERLHLGAELRLAARVTAANLGTADLARLEALVSGQLLLGEQVLLGAAVGTGTFGSPGTPDLRALLRLAWAPRRRGAPPPADTDGDGIPDDRDRCPYEPEDRNGVRDDDGCPEAPVSTTVTRALHFRTPAAAAAAAVPVPDSDGDGIPDDQDFCPLSPEDRDGFEDDDGCPEPDNDSDGIPDAADRCPLEAARPGHPADSDGCPHSGPAPRVAVSSERIELKEQVKFAPNQARIQPASFPLLREIAQILRVHPSFKIEVQGHCDDAGNARVNTTLSQQRAESVRASLIKLGIAPTRLVAKGYGSTRPRFANNTLAGRRLNRRVELVILEGSR